MEVGEKADGNHDHRERDLRGNTGGLLANSSQRCIPSGYMGCYKAWISILTLVMFEMVGFCLRHTTHHERGMREVQSLLEHVTLHELAKSVAQRIWVVIRRESARTILCIGLLPGLSTGLWTFSAAGLFLQDVLASSWLLVSLGPL